MKKKNIILIGAGIALIALIVCVFIFTDLKPANEKTKRSNEILEEFNELYNGKDLSVIYYASSECSYCAMEKPILESIAEEYDMDYYAIDKLELTGADKKEITTALEIEDATPMTVLVKKGKIVDKVEGYVDGDAYTAFFAENGLIPEDADYPAERYITKVDYSTYKELVKTNGTHIIVVGQTSCSHCIAIKPALNKVGEKYDLTINYLNITDMTEDENNDLIDSFNEIGYDEPDFVENGSFGTPLTLVVKDGKVIKYLSGERTTSQLAREFRKLGLIEED